jgi:hypothetical protein
MAFPAGLTAGTLRIMAALAALLSALLIVAAGSRPAVASSTFSLPGYWLAASDGGIYQYGTAYLGSMRGTPLAEPVVGGAASAGGRGYRMVASDGGVFSFGDAAFYGSTGGIRLDRPIVGMATDPITGGYWLVASDGGVFTFHAPFFGSTGGMRLNRPVVGMAATPDGRGYWLVASDGGVFSFGDAHFYGSTGAIRLSRPVVGMAAGPEGKGYWLVASDGGIFAFGAAPYRGSTGGTAQSSPIVGMAGTASGQGYWLVARDGGVFAFNAPFMGSTGGHQGPAPIVTIMATPHGFPFPPGATGYDISLFQCSDIPRSRVGVPIVQVSGGAINNPPNPCYTAEADWAGPSLSDYIFTNPLPNPPPRESLTGPAGTCNGRVTCQAYNFGWYWARNWVAYSRSKGFNPSLWWLDVETDGGWNLSQSAQPANANVIAGAVGGLRSMGVVAGIYATAYQWGEITGNLISYPGILLWVPGAGNISGVGNTAVQFCAHPVSSYEPFAGGSVVLVQYGYSWPGGVPAGSYSGPASLYDRDYACS